MSESSRDKILRRLKNTTREEPENSSSGFDFLKNYHQPLLKTFIEKLEAVSGVFHFTSNISDFKIKLKQFVDQRDLTNITCIEPTIQELLDPPFSTNINHETELAITGCEYLVAQTGSVIVTTTQTRSRRTFAYAPIHLVVAFKNQLVSQLEEGLNLIVEKYKTNLPSQITTITGPSRTADIEKTLVLGAHGPKELIIFYIDEELK